MRRRAGRAHILTILAAIAVIVVAAVFIGSSRATETTTAKSFLSALAEGNADKLASMSYMGDLDQNARLEKWKKTLEYTQYYRFTWRIERAHNPTPNEGIVRVAMRRNAATAGYDEFYELPMVLRDGKWLVDVFGMSRDMYPALPR